MSMPFCRDTALMSMPFCRDTALPPLGPTALLVELQEGLAARGVVCSVQVAEVVALAALLCAQVARRAAGVCLQGVAASERRVPLDVLAVLP
jgi:hypothetical protein